MYKLRDVSKSFVSHDNIVKAVDNVSLDINEHEIFGIIGSSGAGKSTLIRCLNLLERPDKGEVIFKGQDLLSLSKNEVREKRKKIGVIFQNFNLLNSKNVYQNVAFPLRSKSKKEVNKRVLELLELVGLSDKVNSYPAQLSGGQKQRVAIARALANDPDVLLCDEATSALDPQTTKSILSLLKDLNKKLNLTIILITHEMNVIKSICDRVAVMENGKVVEVNDTLTFFTNPTEKISKAFISEEYNLDSVSQLIEKSDDLDIKCTYELVYGAETSNKSILSNLITKFNLDVNIIAGSIEVVSDVSIGRLVVEIKGDNRQVVESLVYLKEEGVIVNEFI